MPPSSDNFSTLLQFLHQELLSSDNHDDTKEKLLSYFHEAGCNDSQLDIIHTSFQKATLDSRAFSNKSVSGQQIGPDEFSHRLVNELSKKFKETKSLVLEISKLEDVCASGSLSTKTSASAPSDVPLTDAIAQFEHFRLSTHNLEAAMISICDQTLRSHINEESGGAASNNRYTSAYDEHILTLRKKLSVSFDV